MTASAIPSAVKYLLDRVIVSDSGCFVWRLSPSGNGYADARLKGHPRTNAHRLSYLVFRGDIPDGMDVCHRCDNKLCINPAHLFVGTRKENLQDSIAKGRFTCGERQHLAKLTEQKVVSIRLRYAAGESCKSLGLEYGVHPYNISYIVRRKTWKHVA